MADTARTKKEEREFFDSPEDLEQKVDKLAEMIRGSSHFIAFTGAGISTSCGIPDFRSGVDTVLDTGAGAWAKKAAIKRGVKVSEPKKRVKSTLKAIPSVTHMSMVSLMEAGLLKHVISQNTDGLHRRSGLPPEKLSELHGNSNLESCRDCGKQYLRDFKTRCARGVKKHETGRRCVCGGMLYDTIINFGECLPESELDSAEQNSNKSDLCLAMGSSLTVTPAADFPKSIGKKRGGSLVVVNLQQTPLDRYCALRIFAKCDEVMQALMHRLKLPIPEWRLQRYMLISIERPPRAAKIPRSVNLTLSAVDRDGTPASLFQTMDFTADKMNKHIKVRDLSKELLPPKTFRLFSWGPGVMKAKDEVSEELVDSEDGIVKKEELMMSEDEIKDARLAFRQSSDDFKVTVSFMGHYKEPDLSVNLHHFVDLHLCDLPCSITLRFKYNPFNGQWENTQVYTQSGDTGVVLDGGAGSSDADALADKVSAMSIAGPSSSSAS